MRILPSMPPKVAQQYHHWQNILLQSAGFCRRSRQILWTTARRWIFSVFGVILVRFLSFWYFPPIYQPQHLFAMLTAAGFKFSMIPAKTALNLLVLAINFAVNVEPPMQSAELVFPRRRFVLADCRASANISTSDVLVECVISALIAIVIKMTVLWFFEFHFYISAFGL